MYGYKDFDEISYLIGFTECFCEMVHADVKQLALSPLVTPNQADAMLPAVEGFSRKYKLSYKLDFDILKSTLVDDAQMEGKGAFLLYRDKSLLDQYYDLKRQEKEAEKAGTYDSSVRIRLSSEFQRLLAYPEPLL